MPLLSFQSDLIMCSITALLGLDQSTETQRDAVIHASSKQHHCGPDWSGVVQTPTAVLSHKRLAIVDVASGSQPLRDPIQGSLLAVNGEMGNHRAWAICGSTSSRPSQKRAFWTKVWPELPRASPSIPPTPKKGIGTVKCLNNTSPRPLQRQPCPEANRWHAVQKRLWNGAPNCKTWWTHQVARSPEFTKTGTTPLRILDRPVRVPRRRTA